MGVNPIIAELANIRRAYEVSAVRASRLIGLSGANVGQWEMGTGFNPSLAHLREYAALFGYEVEFALRDTLTAEERDELRKNLAPPVKPPSTKGPLPAELVTLRRARGIRQQEVADAIGVGISAVSRWESGERRPTFQQAKAYALFVGSNRYGSTAGGA